MMGIMKDIFEITGLLAKGTFQATVFTVKNTPKAIGMAWQVKKELSEELSKVIHEVRLEQKKDAIEDKLLLIEKKSKCKK
jgi:hypothetical protein